LAKIIFFKSQSLSNQKIHVLKVQNTIQFLLFFCNANIASEFATVSSGNPTELDKASSRSLVGKCREQ